MDRKHRSPVSAVGGSSLLVIFSVLCLTVFAVLSLSTARAGSRLSARSAQAAADRCRAEVQAEEILSRLRAGELPAGVSGSNGEYHYTLPISDTQALEVSVRIDGEQFTILRWQSVSTTDWQPDQSLDLWDGG